MPVLPIPGEIALDLASGSTDASGSADLTDHIGTTLNASLHTRRRYRVICTCSASITWSFKVGAVATRMATKQSATGTSAVFSGVDGPWPYAELAWSGNGTAAAVYIDVHVEQG